MTFELFLVDPHFQRVLVAALLVAATAASLGVYLVLRQMSLFGDGIAHIGFAGIAIGFVAGIMPLAMALVASVLGALAIHELRRRSILRGDTAIGIVFTASLALGVVVVSRGASMPAGIESFLFGNVLLTSAADMKLIVATALVVAVALVLLHHAFFVTTMSEEAARVQGLPVGALSTLFTILTAVAVVVCVRVVGVLLVSSLVVAPAAAALQFARGLRRAVVAAALLAMLGTVTGLFVAAELDWAPGATVALANTSIFVLAMTGARLVRR